MMKQSRCLGLLSIAAAGVFVAGGTTTRAQTPISYVQHVDETFPSALWTAVCGSLVMRHQVGTLRITIQEGERSAHEIDTFADWTETLTMPATGASFTQTAGPTQTDYPEGIFVGAPARIVYLGREYSVPGLPQDAGREVVYGQVVFVDDDGLPYTELTAFGPVHGHFNDFSDYVAAGVAALGC